MEPNSETEDFGGLAQRDAWAAMLLGEYRRTGNLRLRDEVYESYSPLTKITATRIAHPLQERDDVIQEARVGLFQAIEEWDPKRRVRFSTWAIAKMRYACVEYARRVIWGTRGMQERYRDAQRRLTAIENGAPLTHEELLNGGPLMPATHDLAPISLDSVLLPVETNGDSDLYLRDTITAGINCEFAALQNLLHADVKARVGGLPEREQLVFRLYYQEGKTFREVGALLGVSESRIFQLHHQGMLRLRASLRGGDEAPPPDSPYTTAEDRQNGERYRRPARRGMARIAA